MLRCGKDKVPARGGRHPRPTLQRQGREEPHALAPPTPDLPPPSLTGGSPRAREAVMAGPRPSFLGHRAGQRRIQSVSGGQAPPSRFTSI